VPFAVDDSNIYAGDWHAIKKLAKDGGLVEALTMTGRTVDVATDGTNVYWIVEGGYPTIMKIPVSGGTNETLWNGKPAGAAGPIKVDGPYVYWLAHRDNICRIPKNGGTAEVIASDLPILTDYAIDGVSIFLAQQYGGFYKMPIDGGELVKIAYEQNGFFPAICFDDLYIYWVTIHYVGKALKTGQQQTRIASGVDYLLNTNNSIAVDDTNVYWTEVGASVILKTSK
jgi:hypothetical protein